MAEASLTLKSYQEQAALTDRKPENLTLPLLGLFGEAGSLLSEIKKQQRDTDSYVGYKNTVLEELGDILWYLTAVASRAQLSLVNIAYASVQGHFDCPEAAPSGLSFAELQKHPASGQPAPTPAFETTILHLAGAVGSIVPRSPNWKAGERSIHHC